MKTNTVREKLRRGEVSVGTWLNLPDPTVATVMTRVGFDWLTVELEHSPTTLVNATLSMSIIAGNGLVPLVRIASNTAENIKRALDCGAWGVVVPMVNSPEEAEAVVRQRDTHPSAHAPSEDSFTPPASTPIPAPITPKPMIISWWQ